MHINYHKGIEKFIAEANNIDEFWTRILQQDNPEDAKKQEREEEPSDIKIDEQPEEVCSNMSVAPPGERGLHIGGAVIVV